MYYNNKDSQPASRGEKIFVLTTVLAGLSLFSLEILSDYEPKKIGAVLFVIFWVPLLVIHEFGHAVMAKILGWKIQRVVLGIGKVFMRSKWLNAPVEIRAIPLEGFVQIAPQNTEWVRSKHALIYFAGPGIELLCVLIITIALGGFSELFTITNDYSRIIPQSFAFTALFGAVLNLIPQGVITANGTTPNDGLGIIMCLFTDTKSYEKWINENNKEENSKDEVVF